MNSGNGFVRDGGCLGWLMGNQLHYACPTSSDGSVYVGVTELGEYLVSEMVS